VRFPSASNQRVIIARGQYTFGQLATWRDAIFDNFLGRNMNVVLLDLNEQTNRVSVGIRGESIVAAKARLFPQFAKLGIDTNAVTLAATSITLANGNPLLLPAPRRTWTDLNSNADTLVGGLKFTYRNTSLTNHCTMGATMSINSNVGFLTAAHCTASWFIVTSDSLWQSDISGSPIGIELYDPSAYSCGVTLCRGSDAAFYKVTGRPIQIGLIAHPDSRAGPCTSGTGCSNGSTGLSGTPPYFIVTDIDSSVYSGLEVNKVGLASGWTYGVVNGTCIRLVSFLSEQIPLLYATAWTRQSYAHASPRELPSMA
jgi:hypothetical protein